MTLAEERLALILIKVERAKQHLSELEGSRQRFLDTEPYAFASKRDPQTGDTVVYMTRVETPPAEIGPIAGDVVHNLRSALDHLACQLVIANGMAPTKQTSFPIYDAAAKYHAGQMGKIKGATAAAINEIDQIEPYQSGKGHLLWVLHELDIADKHRTLLTSITCLTKAVFPTSSRYLAPGCAGRFLGLQFGGTLKAGHVILTFQRELYREVQPTFDISFGKSEVIEGKPVLSTLQRLTDLVRNLITDFQPFL